MSGFLRLLSLSIALFAAPTLSAAEAEPPGRVGRISLASAGTQLRIGDSLASGEDTLNWPLTTGALIETSAGGRSEVRIGSMALHIDGGTALEFADLDDARIRLRLHRGSIVIVLRNPEHAAETTLETPEGSLRFETPGSYRADVAGGTTAFSANRGRAFIEMFGLTVHAGERIVLLGGPDRRYLLGQTTTDAFRQWSLAREPGPALGQHVSPEMTGQEALDRHGIWQETAEYGTAWFPQYVPAGWAPYSMGRWVWVPPWGWTWIDQAPWGFAPFHYGRWAAIGGRWAWLPGAYLARPVYAPALVAWLGEPGWRTSFSAAMAPAARWHPLGPRDTYRPHYRSSPRHVHGINAGHASHAVRSIPAPPPAPVPVRSQIAHPRHEPMKVAPPRQAVMVGSEVQRHAAERPHRQADTRPAPAPAMPAPPPRRHEAGTDREREHAARNGRMRHEGMANSQREPERRERMGAQRGPHDR